MIIPVEDTSYRCKNCDSFGQCEYYHHRRPDSHICKEFRNDWRQRDVLDKISAEIAKNILDEPVENGTNAEMACYNGGLLKCLKIIDKYTGKTDTRDATSEERESVDNYIKSISTKTGRKFDE